MLARPGSLPLSSAHVFELKFDGFRAIVSTEAELDVRSRRGWNMTALLPELRSLPAGLVLDGELIAFNDGRPSFPRLSARLLHKEGHIPIAFVVFDVLARNGRRLLLEPYTARRQLLETLPLPAPAVVAPVYDDGEALFAGVQAEGLEGIVAKRRDGIYRPGERGWIKIKNRDYWRFGQELELAQASRRVRVTI
jgi:bifunctional non-homologous end joining protein LigD